MVNNIRISEISLEYINIYISWICYISSTKSASTFQISRAKGYESVEDEEDEGAVFHAKYIIFYGLHLSGVLALMPFIR